MCVLLGSLFFFLSPFNESAAGPMASGPTEGWPPKTWRPPEVPAPPGPVGLCCRPAVGGRGEDEPALAAVDT